jgi:transcriptional regulator NrdR family protein
MEKFKEITELKKMDGSEKQNRRYCWLCIKKFNGKENVEKLLKIAVKFDFHKANLTSFKYLYYHGVKILNEFKEKVKHPTYIEIKNGKIVR